MKKILLIFSIVFSANVYAQNSVKDVDGNTYKTIKIDSIEWMIENLKTTRYNNGDKIVLKDSSTMDETKYRWEVDKHQLYSWFTITDSRGVCPSGWKIPTDKDFKHTIDFLFKDSNIRMALGVNENFIYMENIDLNKSLFSNQLKFVGSKTPNGTSLFKNFYEYFWTSNEDYTGFSWMWYFSKNAISHYNFDQKGGLSVRCVKYNGKF